VIPLLRVPTLASRAAAAVAVDLAHGWHFGSMPLSIQSCSMKLLRWVWDRGAGNIEEVLLLMR
jgi:hypothetical protein